MSSINSLDLGSTSSSKTRWEEAVGPSLSFKEKDNDQVESSWRADHDQGKSFQRNIVNSSHLDDGRIPLSQRRNETSEDEDKIFIRESLSKMNGSDEEEDTTKQDETLLNEEEDDSGKLLFIPAFPNQMSNCLSGMSRVTTQDVDGNLQLGVPLQGTGHDRQQHTFVLYLSTASIPKKNVDSSNQAGGIPLLGWSQAVENCEDVAVILTPLVSKRPRQCLALVPQESGLFHTFHFGRYEALRRYKRSERHPKAQDLVTPLPGNQTGPPPLQRLGRTVMAHHDWLSLYTPEEEREIAHNHFSVLKGYTQHRDQMKLDVAAVLEKVADPETNTVIVMAASFGQVGFLINWVCSVRTHGMLHVLKHVFVLALDQRTYDKCQDLGLAAYFQRDLYGEIPQGPARWGTKEFGIIVLAKLYAAQIASELGYNFLFQDVDLVWFRNPLEYFHQNYRGPDKYDIIFQEDGNPDIRQAPFFANTGLYYVQSNSRTQNFFASLVSVGGLTLFRYNDDQISTNHLLAEHAMLYGLRVKTIAARSQEGLLFLGGYHVNQPSKASRQAFSLARDKNNNSTSLPYTFHAYWTADNKEKWQRFGKVGESRAQRICLDLSMSPNMSTTDYMKRCCEK